MNFRIIAEQYERAQTLLKDHRTALESVTRQLLEEETVEGTAVKQALTVFVSALNNDSRDDFDGEPMKGELFALREGTEEKQ